MSLPVQVCALPHAEVQEYCQASGGPPTGMQPRCVPGADPCGPQQNCLQCCGTRLVLISVATGQFPNFWSQPRRVCDSFSVASENNTLNPGTNVYEIKSIPSNNDDIVVCPFVKYCVENPCQAAECLFLCTTFKALNKDGT